ncbi:MAG: hypothetical protein JNM10_10525 [Planctomycetia bacterium]|nr:hypothetical protein [Planctomycetia bacterium]
MPRPARLAVVVSAALAAVAAAGCTARPTHRIAAAPAAPRDGWVTLGPRVRLRDDTPPLDTVLPPAPAPEASGTTWGAAGDAGASGSAGPSTWPGAYDGGYGAGYGYGYTTFLAPGGAVPPGLRPPSDERATSPFAQPFKTAFPGADVTAHRPGLSTGSGLYGRKDDAPKPEPTPRR